MINYLKEEVGMWLYSHVWLPACLEIDLVISLCLFHLLLAVKGVWGMFPGPTVKTVSFSRKHMQQFWMFAVKLAQSDSVSICVCNAWH